MDMKTLCVVLGRIERLERERRLIAKRDATARGPSDLGVLMDGAMAEGVRLAANIVMGMIMTERAEGGDA